VFGMSGVSTADRPFSIGSPKAIGAGVALRLCAAAIDDIRALPSARLLLTWGDHEVFCARALELPNVLREIGRLREITFRTAGEGTGRNCDVDVFDRLYWHLFVWNTARLEICRRVSSRPDRSDRPCTRRAGTLFTIALPIRPQVPERAGACS
jgi:hypothetical protein